MSTTRPRFASTSRTLTLSRRLLALVLTSAFIAGSAAAQTHAAQPAASPAAAAAKRQGPGQGHTITYKDKTSYDFDDEQVQGTLIQPDSDIVTGRGKASHKSLVCPRTTFQPEMLKSVESL